MVVEVGSCLQSVMWVGIHNATIECSTVVAIGVVCDQNSNKPVEFAYHVW